MKKEELFISLRCAPNFKQCDFSMYRRIARYNRSMSRDTVAYRLFTTSKEHLEYDLMRYTAIYPVERMWVSYRTGRGSQENYQHLASLLPGPLSRWYMVMEKPSTKVKVFDFSFREICLDLVSPSGLSDRIRAELMLNYLSTYRKKEAATYLDFLKKRKPAVLRELEEGFPKLDHILANS